MGITPPRRLGTVVSDDVVTDDVVNGWAAHDIRGCIFHIAENSVWEAAQETGIYAVASLEDEGFIHCSTPEQTVATANRYYRGRNDVSLLVLQLDMLASLDVPVVWEDTSSRGEDFPHLYSALPTHAIREILPFTPGPTGEFTQASIG
ncbi:MAG: hypothetical protein ACI8Y4_002453 [Candidatus Poriferisodalaceae bacterium]